MFEAERRRRGAFVGAIFMLLGVALISVSRTHTDTRGDRLSLQTQPARSGTAASTYRPRVSNEYGVNGNVHSAPHYYTWRHIAEPHRATTFDVVAVDSDDDGAKVEVATWSFKLLQGVAGQKPELTDELIGYPGVTRNFTEAGRMFLVTMKVKTADGDFKSSDFELAVK